MEIGGTVERGFEPVRDAFAANFDERGDLGAACCVYVGGTPVVDLWGGLTRPDGTDPYGPQTLQIVASATKGAVAICAAQLAAEGRLDVDAPVAEYWPEFSAAGKAELPVRYLLNHQAGLPAPERQLTLDESLDWATVCAALAETPPFWEPGSAHGYHAFTYGWLVGEVLARITGQTPGQLIAERIARPLGLDLHVGLPAAEHARVAPMRPVPPPPPGAEPDPLTARYADPDQLAGRAFFVEAGLFAGLFADPRTWVAEIPAANGMATAHALARMYAACLGEIDGVRLLDDAMLDVVAAEQCAGDDLITGYFTRYGLGFQLPFPYRPMAGDGSFGHYGLGGTTAFASRRHGFALGYTPNQMGPGVPADARSVALVDAVIDCL
jgi:CubicO group peptidase (beta-lactamase class C family)